MNELSIELVGRGTRWNFSKREIRIGRDPACDLVLSGDQYPMVSRNHLLLRLEADQCWVEDLDTSGGTLANGKRIQRAPISPGDVVQLAADGPELRIYFRSAAPAMHATAAAGYGEAQPARHTLDAPTQIPPGLAEATAHPRLQSSENRQTLVPPNLTQDEDSMGSSKSGSSGNSGAAQTAQFPAREIAILEQKIKTVRNLLAATLILVVILGGIILNQSRAIESNRQDLTDMRKDAVERLMPTLHQRLTDFDARLKKSEDMMNGMDGKIQQAENRFIKRIEAELPGLLDRELPKILNKYIDEKLRSMPKPPTPATK
jgi:hypothetical protein